MDFADDSYISKYAKLLKLFGNPIRLKLAIAIMEKKCRVGKLADCINEHLTIVSQQIAILRKSGVIEGKRDKNIIRYTITDDFAEKILELIAMQKNEG